MPSSYSTRHLTAGSGVSRSVLLLVALLGLSRVWACSAQQVAETGQTAVTQYSAICVVAKNENRYIREWVEYHKCLGGSAPLAAVSAAQREPNAALSAVTPAQPGGPQEAGGSQL